MSFQTFLSRSIHLPSLHDGTPWGPAGETGERREREKEKERQREEDRKKQEEEEEERETQSEWNKKPKTHLSLELHKWINNIRMIPGS